MKMKIIPKEQFRLRLILLEDKLEKMGFKDYVDFVRQTVCDCARAGDDSDVVFLKFGKTRHKNIEEQKPGHVKTIGWYK